jgi:SAM-dependent methyltransferase
MDTDSIYSASAYDSFAWFYDRYWGEDFARPAMAIYDQLLFPRLNADARILDLCCGTGQLAAALHARGYVVTGVDGSSAMLAFARAHASAVNFIQADVRALPALPNFDAVISAFDSLNHIMSLTELTDVFINVYRLLKDEGTFLFDLNLETEEDSRPQTYDVVEDDHTCVVQATYDPAEKLKRYQVTMFRKQKDRWQRGDLLLEQRYYNESEVVAALAEAGFQHVRTYDARRSFDLQLSDGRMFFVAQKRERQEKGAAPKHSPR